MAIRLQDLYGLARLVPSGFMTALAVAIGKPSLELVLVVAGAASVQVFGLNPSLVLVAGGAIGAIAIRGEPEVAR